MTAVDAGPRSTFTGSIRVRLRAPARRRNIELVLLLFALGIGGAAIALVQLGALGRVGTSVLLLSGLVGILVLGDARRAPRRRARRRPVRLPDRDPAERHRHRRDHPPRHRRGTERLGRRRHPADRLDRDRRHDRHRHDPRHPQSPRAAALPLRRDVHGVRAAGAAGHPRHPQPALRRLHLDPDRPALVPARRARQDRPRRLLRRLPGAGARLALAGRHGASSG